jgi:hypothetical protein
VEHRQQSLKDELAALTNVVSVEVDFDACLLPEQSVDIYGRDSTLYPSTVVKKFVPDYPHT